MNKAICFFVNIYLFVVMVCNLPRNYLMQRKINRINKRWLYAINIELNTRKKLGINK